MLDGQVAREIHSFWRETDNWKKPCEQNLVFLFYRYPCFCPVNGISLCDFGESKCMFQASFKDQARIISNVAFLMIGVEVNQADKHTQIDEKIKRDGFECMLESEFVADLRGNLLYALIISKIFIRKRTSFRH